MNRKFIAMSAMSLMLSMSFVNTGYAEEAQPAPFVLEPAASGVPAATSAEPQPESAVAETPKAEAGKGGETKKMLGEVTVTSTTIDDRFEAKRGEASNISNISGKKVDEEHGKNLVEILESIPGVTAEVQSGDFGEDHAARCGSTALHG